MSWRQSIFLIENFKYKKFSLISPWNFSLNKTNLLSHPVICLHDHIVGNVASAPPALAPVKAVSVLLAVDFDGVALVKGQLFLAGVGVRRHGGRVVVEQRHEPAHPARATLRRRPRPAPPVLVAGAASVESGVSAAALAVVVAVVVRRPLVAAAHVLLLRGRRRPAPLHVRAGAVVAAPLKVVLAVVLAVRVLGDF